MKRFVFRDITLFSPLEADRSEEHFASIFRAADQQLLDICLSYSSTLTMEAIFSS
jgi:hypothetical protein